MTDTVGFIRKLPHQLVEAFPRRWRRRWPATWSAVVADASADEEQLYQLASVRAVLDDIGARRSRSCSSSTRSTVVDPLTRRRLSNRYPDAVLVSARTGENLDELKRRVAAFFAERYVDVRLLVPHDRGAACRRSTRPARRSRRARTRPRASWSPPACRGGSSTDSSRSGGRRVTIELPVKVLDPAARIPGAPYDGDAGLDLASVEDCETPQAAGWAVRTGLAVAIPEGYAGFVQPRSGLALHHGITVLNTPGLIDSGYRGELVVVLQTPTPSSRSGSSRAIA